jgi:hypothetical protein
MINEDKYKYIESLISKYGHTHKLLFCSEYDKCFMKYFLKKKYIFEYFVWKKISTGCTFINTHSIDIDIIKGANKIILLDNGMTDKICELMKIKNNIEWHLNICS